MLKVPYNNLSTEKADFFEYQKEKLCYGIFFNPFLSNVLFWFPWNHQKTKG